jgi:hypothetical protein
MRRPRTRAHAWLATLSAIVVILAIVGSDVTIGSLPFAVPAPPRTSAVYGPGIAADALANTQIGGTSCGCPNLRSSFRFRASGTSLVAFRMYLIIEKDGYAGGTGGSVVAAIHRDDGTPAHHPADSPLATTAVPLEPFPHVRFVLPVGLEAGELYHLVFENTDPAPTANFVSLNSLFTDPPIVPRQAQFTDVDWAQLMDYGDGWRLRPEYTPILQLEWAGGRVDGVGYMESWIGAAKVLSGAARAGETFIVSGGDVMVSRVAVRLARLAGDGPLTIRLERGNGLRLAEGEIPASAFPVSEAGTHARSTWVTWTVDPPIRLLDLHRYNLELSTDGETRYQVHVLRKGVAVGFRPPTYFGDGSARYDPGTGWVAFDPGWRGPLDQSDLQFYLD